MQSVRSIQENCCHCEQAPGAPFLASFARSGNFFATGKLRLMIALSVNTLIALLSLALPLAAASDTPQDLLAAGRVDQAIQTLEQQIHTTPTAEAYNLLCRAHFELDAWDAGIPACEKAVSLDPANGLYHLWLGRIYGEKADRAGFIKAAVLAKKVRVEFERAVELEPNNWESHTDLDRKSVEFERAVELEPNNWESHTD